MTDVSCHCVAHQSKTRKHIAALIHFINTSDSFSQTDFEQLWGKPTVTQFGKKKNIQKDSFLVKCFLKKKKKNVVDEVNFTISDLKDDSIVKLSLIEANKDKTIFFMKSILDYIIKKCSFQLKITVIFVWIIFFCLLEKSNKCIFVQNANWQKT